VRCNARIPASKRREGVTPDGRRPVSQRREPLAPHPLVVAEIGPAQALPGFGREKRKAASSPRSGQGRTPRGSAVTPCALYLRVS
jgi:hypothetical protein